MMAKPIQKSSGSTLLLLSLICVSSFGNELKWRELTQLPDQHGFAAPFAGESNGYLIVAGGANFPNKPLWETEKVWHDSIFIYNAKQRNWHRSQTRLPQPVAYGVSLTLNNDAELSGVLCIGGGDAKGHFRTCYLLRVEGKRVITSPLPSLPIPMAFGCGTTVGTTVIIAGGLDEPAATTALNAAFALDFRRLEDGWRKLPKWPGQGRMLSVAAGHKGKFYMVAGTALHEKDGKAAREYLNEALVYELATNRWKKLPAPPAKSVAAPTPAPIVNGKILILGGDTGKYATQVDTLKDRHPGFPTSIYGFDIATAKWSKLKSRLPRKMAANPEGNPHASVWPAVTAPTVPWGDGFLVPAGEVRPRVRSRRVLFARPTSLSRNSP